MTAALALLAARGAAPVADLPFEHLPGRILLKGKVNERPVEFALDTGASVSVVDEGLAREAGAKEGTAVPVTGNGVDSVSGWRAEGLRLTFEGSTIALPVRLAVPLGSVNGKAARPIAGIVGCDLLRRYVAEIDFVHGRLRLFDPAGFSAPKGYGASPLKIVRGRPMVEGSVKAAGVAVEPVSMLIDSGIASGIDLSEDLVRRSGLAEKVVGEVTDGAAGLGGNAKTRVVFGATGRVGSAGFSGGVRLFLSSGGAQMDHDVTVGDAFLRHFDVVLDLPHSTLYLRSNGQ